MREADKALLDLLGNALFNAQVKIPENLDWAALYEEAKVQAVLPLVFDAAAKVAQIPTEIAAKCTQACVQYAFNNEQLLYEQQHVLDLMHTQGIPCVILKGSSAALWYPNPDLRIMGDIDILVPPERQTEATDLLKNDGYERVSDDEHHCHIGVVKGRVVVEVHKEPNGLDADENGDIARKFSAYFANAVSESHIENGFRILSDKDQAVALLFHKLKHFLNGALGLRQLCDWAVFVNRRMTPELWKALQPVLEDFGLLYFTGVITRVCVDFLKLPLEKAPWAMAYDASLAQNVLEEILRSGNFGRKQSAECYGQSFFTDVRAANSVTSFAHALVAACKRTWKPCEKYPVLLPIGACAVLVRHIRKRRSGQRAAFKPLAEMKLAKAQRELYKSLKPFAADK